jgi:hypothetical protein
LIASNGHNSLNLAAKIFHLTSNHYMLWLSVIKTTILAKIGAAR